MKKPENRTEKPHTIVESSGFGSNLAWRTASCLIFIVVFVPQISASLQDTDGLDDLVDQLPYSPEIRVLSMSPKSIQNMVDSIAEATRNDCPDWLGVGQATVTDGSPYGTTYNTWAIVHQWCEQDPSQVLVKGYLETMDHELEWGLRAPVNDRAADGSCHVEEDPGRFMYGSAAVFEFTSGMVDEELSAWGGCILDDPVHTELYVYLRAVVPLDSQASTYNYDPAR